MKRNKTHLLRSLAAAVLLCTGLASCSQDELANTQGEPLPEGKYPLEIASVSLSAEVTDEPWGANHAPQTRVAENPDGNSSKWEYGDKIHVLINGGGFADEELVCTLDADGQVKEYSKTLYWKDTSPATYTAWYDTADQDGKVDLSDQSNKLAYVLTCEGDAGYNTQMDLNFTHVLAKVRVIVEGSKAENVEEVKILSYPQCTYTQGKVEGLETKDYITMHHQNGTMIWEANVVAEQLINDDLNKYVKLIRNDSEEDLIVSITLNNSNTLQAGKINEIRINAKGKPMTITDNGTYEITGNSEPIIIKEGNSPTITFKNVTLTTDERSKEFIRIEQNSNPTLIFEGNNVLRNDHSDLSNPASYPIYSSSNFNIELKNGAKLAIIGKATSPIFIKNSKLSISGNGDLYLYGNRYGCPAIQCENGTSLNIEGVTLTAVSGQSDASFGAKTNLSYTVNVAIDLKNCTLKLYGDNGNESRWVFHGGNGTIKSNGNDIDVNTKLKNDTDWGTEVEIPNGIGVMATKLENAPDIPEWAKK